MRDVVTLLIVGYDQGCLMPSNMVEAAVLALLQV